MNDGARRTTIVVESSLPIGKIEMRFTNILLAALLALFSFTEADLFPSTTLPSGTVVKGR